MDKLYGMVLGPFVLFAMLLVARPFLLRVRRMKDSRLKRFLLISWK